MCDFVRGHIDLGFISHDDGGWSKGQQRVFHASEGEGGWQDQDGVLSPNVGCQPGLSEIQEVIKLRELINISIEIVYSWLWNYWWAGVLISYSLFLKISNSYGNKIAGYLYILVEVIGWEIPNLISLRQLHSTHFHDIWIFDSNIGGIGGLDCRCVLKWGHWPAVDRLALSEHVPHYLGSCLLLGEPGHGLGVCVGLVSDR